MELENIAVANEGIVRELLMKGDRLTKQKIDFSHVRRA